MFVTATRVASGVPLLFACFSKVGKVEREGPICSDESRTSGIEDNMIQIKTAAPIQETYRSSIKHRLLSQCRG